MRRLILTAVLAFCGAGCAGVGTPKVQVGMNQVEADRICLQTFPPAFPYMIRMNEDGTFTKVYLQSFDGRHTFIRWEERDGILTDLSITGF